jgi:hypothetical protein
MHKGGKLGYTNSLIKPNHFWTFPKKIRPLIKNQSERVKFGSGVALKGRGIPPPLRASIPGQRPGINGKT